MRLGTQATVDDWIPTDLVCEVSDGRAHRLMVVKDHDMSVFSKENPNYPFGGVDLCVDTHVSNFVWLTYYLFLCNVCVMGSCLIVGNYPCN